MAPAKALAKATNVPSMVEGRLDAFYSSMFIPNHLRNMLLLYGISMVEHLKSFDKAAVTALAEEIRAGTLTGTFVDMTSKQEQMKYFGANVVNLSGFRFRPHELILLESLSSGAEKSIEAETKGVIERARRNHKKMKFSSGSSSDALPNCESTTGGGLSQSQRLVIKRRNAIK